jgi:DNA-binding GntR family transcriptional regulator
LAQPRQRRHVPPHATYNCRWPSDRIRFTRIVYDAPTAVHAAKQEDKRVQPSTANEPVEPSKHEVAYQKIRERILDGRYGPGHRLVLSALARDLSISPVPVREAIRRLEAEGLVTFVRNVGARVQTLDDGWEQLVEMLALLDGYALARAHPRIPVTAIEQAQEINNTLRRSLTQPLDHAEVMALHRTFHRTIYEHCDNEYLIESLDRTWDRIDASRVLVSRYPTKRLASAVDEHDFLLQQLRESNNDPAALEHCARQHSLNAITAIRGRGRLHPIGPTRA